MDTIKLEAEPRTVFGKRVKTLRRQGLVPANIYGNHQPSQAVQLNDRDLQHSVMRASRSTLFSLAVNGNTQTVLVKDIRRNAISGQLLHVDFQAVGMTEKLKTAVPLHFVGVAGAVKAFEGTLLHGLTSVQVESLPADLPHNIEVDVSSLETLEDSIYVRDLSAPSGITILDDPDDLVAKVLPPTVEVEEPVEEAPEEAEAEPSAEAEEQPAAAAESE